MRTLLALLLLVAACGDDVENVASDLSASDLSIPLDLNLNLGVCDCLQQLCAVPCSQYIPGMYPTLGCLRCLHDGQQSPDMGCVGPIVPGACGACYGIAGCADGRF